MKPITERPSNDDSSGSDRRSAAVRLALSLLRAYKILGSPFFAGSCRFLPSCADYAAEAVAVHGVIRGSWLAAKRLGRCHPLCAAGHDPVPVRYEPPSLPGTARDGRNSWSPVIAVPVAHVESHGR